MKASELYGLLKPYIELGGLDRSQVEKVKDICTKAGVEKIDWARFGARGNPEDELYLRGVRFQGEYRYANHPSMWA